MSYAYMGEGRPSLEATCAFLQLPADEVLAAYDGAADPYPHYWRGADAVMQRFVDTELQAHGKWYIGYNATISTGQLEQLRADLAHSPISDVTIGLSEAVVAHFS